MTILFVDTNLFIQCKDLYQIAWNELDIKDEITLYISRPVQEEIDKLKHDGSNRRSKRAKKTNSFFREIINEDGFLTIKENPLVNISFSPIIKLDNEIPDILDLSKNDDRIIAEAFIYNRENKQEEVFLLTHDTNPILTAKRCNLRYKIIPDEWLLPPENDPKEKKIIELERRIKSLEKDKPIIEFNIKDKNEKDVKQIDILICNYSELQSQDIEVIMSDLKIKKPLKTDFDKGPNESLKYSFGMSKYVPPKDEDIKSYSEEYSDWIYDLEEFLETFHEHAEIQSYYYEFTLSIENIGSVPANNTVIEMHLYGDFQFDQNFYDETQKSIEVVIPKPPIPPSGKFIQQDPFYMLKAMRPYSMGLNDYKPSIQTYMNHKKDPHIFYYKSNTSTTLTDKIVFECKEFRHQVNKEEFNIVIKAESESKNGRVEFLVTANNLTKPLKRIFPINVKSIKKSSLDYIQEIINDFR